MVLNIPLDLRELLGRSVLCSPAAAYISFSLANIADIESYQLGYRIDGLAGEDLTGWEEGEWLPYGSSSGNGTGIRTLLI
ncbi:hypothetical protein M3650_25320 [Paenibacillus sp. MER TA 81-3]|uniref:hypothetical protein n=1 Tax=Paenibacillus sp. MER TA 81-3 TaxID=2939573 RepID=UPI00203C63F2|nr:hypothetical protein [Paenibacillus sp. MER TA 81-3]MCM3341856.1 hypothetical protein [Paenibacillus sp. MER TA 81-3]